MEFRTKPVAPGEGGRALVLRGRIVSGFDGEKAADCLLVSLAFFRPSVPTRHGSRRTNNSQCLERCGGGSGKQTVVSKALDCGHGVFQASDLAPIDAPQLRANCGQPPAFLSES